jgi:excisionase family DNA binding protein
MTKQQAADYLGVTIRSIEAYAAKGKLTPMRAKGTRGDITVYNEEELARLKQEREQASYVPNFAALAPRPQQQAIAPQPPSFDWTSWLLTRLSDPQFMDAIGKLVEVIAKHSAATKTADRLALTLKEASDLSGLSTTTLRNDIHSGELKAKIIGRGWKIRRADLDSYMSRVWK